MFCVNILSLYFGYDMFFGGEGDRLLNFFNSCFYWFCYKGIYLKNNLV